MKFFNSQKAGSEEGMTSIESTSTKDTPQPPQPLAEQAPNQPTSPASQVSEAPAPEKEPSASLSPPAAAPAAPKPPRKVRPPRQDPERRLAALMARNPNTWTSKDVGGWLEGFGLGQYRKAFIHNAVAGSMLSKISDKVLKEDLGISNLGHREVLTRAIAGLLAPWEGKDGGAAVISASTGSPVSSGDLQGPPAASPPTSALEIPGTEILRAQERRAKLEHELEKAEARLSQRREKVEQAQRTAELADREVQRLRTALKEAEVEAKGGIKKVAAAKLAARAGTRAGTATVGKKPGTAAGGGGGKTFMERLQADLDARKSKQRLGGRPAAASRRSDTQSSDAAAAPGTLGSNLEFLRKLWESKDADMAAALKAPASISAAEAAAGQDGDAAVTGQIPPTDAESTDAATALTVRLDDLAAQMAVDDEVCLPDQEVEAVKALQGPARKAQKLVSAAKSARFQRRLAQDLVARQERQKEQQRAAEAERAAAAKAAEEKDLKEARDAFAVIGISGEAGTQTDELLGALLRRAKTAQEARAAGKEPQWEAHRGDGLLAAAAGAAPPLPPPPPPPAPAAASGDAIVGAVPTSELAAPSAAPAEPPASGPPALLEVVNLLSRCRGDELQRLEALAGVKKQLATFRALRAQQFVRAAREKAEAKAAKVAEALAAREPERKTLPKEAGAAFLERLAEDAAKRERNRQELIAKALEEEKAKIAAAHVPKSKGAAAASAAPK